MKHLVVPSEIATVLGCQTCKYIKIATNSVTPSLRNFVLPFNESVFHILAAPDRMKEIIWYIFSLRQNSKECLSLSLQFQ